LTKVTERQFEIPFGQLLSIQGHKVIHHARPHGPMEQGKDLISIDSLGVYHAYQLKQGDLTLEDWRSGGIKDQVADMLDLDIQHPSVPAGSPYKSHLVTTGLLNDVLRQTLEQYNRTREGKGQSTLDVITKGHIKEQLLTSYNAFIPIDPELFRDFLQLITSDLKGLPEKKTLFNFYRAASFQFLGDNPSKANLKRVGDYLWLVTSHISYFYESSSNWIAALEVWIVSIAAYMKICGEPPSAKLAIKDLSNPLYKISLLMRLYLDDFDKLKDLHAERFGLEDAYLIGSRITVCLGWAAASILYLGSIGRIKDSEILDLLPKFIKWLPLMQYWGESACPLFLSVVWIFKHYGATNTSEHYLIKLLSFQLQSGRLARNKDPTLAGTYYDPYDGLEEILIKSLENQERDILIKNPSENRVVNSYFLEGIVLMITKRLWRQNLTAIWPQISEMSLSCFRFKDPSDFWTWRADQGSEISWEWSRPTSWAALLKRSRSIDDENLPLGYGGLGAFHLLHLIVFPHRVSTDMLLTIDNLSSQWIKRE